MAQFHKLITDRRKELNMTQKELAQMLNVSDKTISKWETGRSYPDMYLLKPLAKSLQMDMSALLEIDEMNEHPINQTAEIKDDHRLIQTYKNKTLILIGVILTSFILLFFSIISENDTLRTIFIVLGIVLLLFSILFSVIVHRSFRVQYARTSMIQLHDTIFVRYASINLIVLVLPAIFMSLLVSNPFSFSTIDGNMSFVSLLIVLCAIGCVHYLHRIAHFKVKIDVLNISLGGLSLVLLGLIVAGLLPIFILPIMYGLLFIIPFRNIYNT